MTRIVILTAADEPALPGLEALPDDVTVDYAEDERHLEKLLTTHDVLVVTDFRDDLLARCWPEDTSIRWVHATSAGVDALMFPALVNSDIPITNARGIFNRGIAEYVLGAILAFAKDTFGNIYNQQQERWQHRETPLIEKQRVLIVGAGSIGGCVGQLLHAAGLTVSGIARSSKTMEGFEGVYPQTELLEHLPDADYVVITAPLTNDTEGLFNEKAFSEMKSSAVLINVGRGPIVNTQALLRALNKEQIAGAALDVFEEEPLPEGHPLWGMHNVMISAHMAGDFIGWRKALGEQFTENFLRWQAGKELKNQVKKPGAPD